MLHAVALVFVALRNYLETPRVERIVRCLWHRRISWSFDVGCGYDIYWKLHAIATAHERKVRVH